MERDLEGERGGGGVYFDELGAELPEVVWEDDGGVEALFAGFVADFGEDSDVYGR